MKILKKLWCFFSLFILFVLSLVYFIMVKENGDSYEINYLKDQIALMKTREWIQFQSENSFVDSSLVVFDEKQKPIKVKQLIGNQPKLVVRFSSLNCKQCVDSLFVSVKSLIEEIGDKNVLILASDYQSRNLMLFKRFKKIGFPIYKLNDKKTGIPLEKYSMPFLFFLYPDSSSKYVFVPEKSMSELTDNYFQIIRKNLVLKD